MWANLVPGRHKLGRIPHYHEGGHATLLNPVPCRTQATYVGASVRSVLVAPGQTEQDHRTLSPWRICQSLWQEQLI
eukprot:scaffold7234_cov335-Prasinococcus_capsulatus_cf.AAC.5